MCLYKVALLQNLHKMLTYILIKYICKNYIYFNECISMYTYILYTFEKGFGATGCTQQLGIIKLLGVTASTTTSSLYTYTCTYVHMCN